MTAKLDNAARATAALLAVLAVGAGATACGSDAGSAPGAAAHSATAEGSPSGQRDGGGSEAGDGTRTPAGGGAADGDAGKASAGAGDEGPAGAGKKTAAQGSRTGAVNTTSVAGDKRCHTGDLRYSWDSAHGGHPDMDAADQQVASIRLQNGGKRTCTLRGFPGVRLIGASGEKWDLRRSADTPSTLTLRPGDDTVLVTMNVLPTAKDDPDTKPFVPSQVLLTPPDETEHITLDWPYGGALVEQSGATHPGTFVNPVGIG